MSRSSETAPPSLRRTVRFATSSCGDYDRQSPPPIDFAGFSRAKFGLTLLSQFPKKKVSDGVDAPDGIAVQVRLIAPVYVEPFVKRQKNDMADAEAITEAAARPTMRFVAMKSAEKQAPGMGACFPNDVDCVAIGWLL